MSSFRRNDKRFDRVAATYSQAVEHAFPITLDHQLFVRTKAEILLQVLSRAKLNAESSRILDVGCGTGLLHSHLAKRVKTIVGIDVSEKSLEVARRKNPSVIYQNLVGEILPFDDSTFSLTCAICLLHHVHSDLQQGLVAEMIRVTSQGGVVAIIEHNPYNPVTQHVVRNCELDQGVLLLRPNKSRSLLIGGGAKTAGVRYFQFLPTDRPLVQTLEGCFSWLPLGTQYLVEGRV